MTVLGVFFSTWPDDFPIMARGLLTALELTGVSLAIGFPLGLLFAVMTMASSRPLNVAALLFVEIGRGAPLLILLELIYFGLPQAHLTLTQFTAAVVAFAWSTGAYSSEILRASLEAVPHGQREAAAAVGFSRLDASVLVILPQAIRIAIPPLMSVAIQIFQATSLAFVIALPEVMSRAYETGSVTFEYLNVFLLAAALYAAVSLPASLLVGIVERRLGRHLEHTT
ncbi:MAG: polar amino acid transport system permease protein [Actinomycetota bacterium]|jgi:polar amino acid transport system permease protein|nr:polar amino acid transport system permease protein [Actinomycetota bacterium]